MQCRSCGREIGAGESVDNGICGRCRGGAVRRGSGVGVGAGVVLLGVKMLTMHTTAGLPVIGVGLVVLFFALVLSATSSARQRSVDAKNEDSSEGPQIAGKTCPVCEKKILSVLDGVTCAKCKAACHGDCLGQHAIAAHGGAKKHPYRK